MPVTLEQKEQGIATLAKMIALLGLRAEVRDASHDDMTVLSVHTDTPGRLIGRKGQYLESLELVLNRIVKKKAEDYPGITIDIDGYQKRSGSPHEAREHESREREPRNRGPERSPRGRGPSMDRDEGLSPEVERMALDAAKEVRLWGEPKAIGPFPAAVQRAIHAVLRSVPEVQAESGSDEGNNMKKVIIRLVTPGKPGAAAGAAGQDTIANGGAGEAKP